MSDVERLIVKLTKAHAEKRVWPMTRNDPKAGADGYIYYCAEDKDPWPCDVARLLAALRAES